jgi:F0F1-type ATP synthase membrane subunit b/b'
MSEERLYLEISIWSQVASSILFLGALIFIWNKWIQPVVMAAQGRSNAQIAESERHRDEARGALDALREEIESARRDAELIEQRAELHAQRERESILKDATEAGERALRDAGGELERARAAARLRLRDELLERALQIARRDAATRVDPALDSRLVERFVGSLEEIARG